MSLLVGTTAGAFSIGDSTDQLIADARVDHIVGDGAGWWAIDDQGRIHHDGEVVAQMPEGARANCIQPTPKTVWVGADQARLFTLEGDQLTEDEFFVTSPGRESWYTPWGGPADVRSMTLDADHTLYVNVHVGGILRYDNTGLVPTVDIDADVHQVAAHPSLKGAIFAATAWGLASSHNGHDFEFRSDGLHASYCRAVTVLDDRVVFSASTGPRSTQGRLYTCPLWEDEIEPVTAGLPEWFDSNVDTHCLVGDGTTVYAGHRDQVWRSDDSGVSWAPLIGGLGDIKCIS